MKRNIFFEFAIQLRSTSIGLDFDFDKTHRTCFRVDTKKLYSSLSFENYHVLMHLRPQLEIVETSLSSEFSSDGSNIRKDGFILIKDSKFLALLEIYSPSAIEDNFLIHFFVKEINKEELRLMLEFVLSKKLESILIPLRDKITNYVLSKSFKP